MTAISSYRSRSATRKWYASLYTTAGAAAALPNSTPHFFRGFIGERDSAESSIKNSESYRIVGRAGRASRSGYGTGSGIRKKSVLVRADQWSTRKSSSVMGRAFQLVLHPFVGYSNSKATLWLESSPTSKASLELSAIA